MGPQSGRSGTLARSQKHAQSVASAEEIAALGSSEHGTGVEHIELREFHRIGIPVWPLDLHHARWRSLCGRTQIGSERSGAPVVGDNQGAQGSAARCLSGYPPALNTLLRPHNARLNETGQRQPLSLAAASGRALRHIVQPLLNLRRQGPLSREFEECKRKNGAGRG